MKHPWTDSSTLAYSFQRCRSTRTSKKRLACCGKLQHSHCHESGWGSFKSWCQREWLCPSDEIKFLVKWHKWQSASSSITLYEYVWEDCQSIEEFLKTRLQLIGSAHTDGSPVDSNCLCSLHALPLASESLHKWCHTPYMWICVCNCEFISPVALLFASSMNKASCSLLREQPWEARDSIYGAPQMYFKDNVWLKHCGRATVSMWLVRWLSAATGFCVTG